jgi:L-fuconolactonase
MDIVDAQIHLFLTIGPEAGLAAMDALGIQAAVIDEFWGYNSDTDEPQPGHHIEDGAFRPLAPGAQMASLRYPDRFSYLLRLDYRDPDLDWLAKQTAANPAARALRVEARKPREVRDLSDGKFAAAFASAGKYQLPICVLTVDNAPLLAPYAERFPDTTIIIDHIGLPNTLDGYEAVLRLAKYPNVVLKWCHAPRVFKHTEYPFEPIMPLFRKAIDAFGRERIMWASDFTAVKTGHRWADILFYVRESNILSTADKEWILGRTARSVFKWPAPETPAVPLQHRH